MIEDLRRLARELPRPWKRGVTVSFDVVMLAMVLWGAYRARLPGPILPDLNQALLLLLAPAIAVPVFASMGLYRAVVRYMPERVILVIAQAMLFSTAAWVALVFTISSYGIAAVPRSLPILYFVLGTIVIAGSRLAVKRFLKVRSTQQSGLGSVLIYGADGAGMQLAAAFAAHGGRRVAGFIDDNPMFHGRDMGGITVFSPDAAAALVKAEGVTEIILATPALPRPQRDDLYLKFSTLPLKVRTLPAITDLASGKYAIGSLREIDIDDLLGRSVVPADPELLRSIITDRVIMVSGAAGSIGSELSRLIARWSPRRVVLLDANEFALYEIGRRLARETDVQLVQVLGSVTEPALMRRVIAREEVEVVFHAAAYKHVPLLEDNAIEAVRNNVFGTATLAQAALDGGVATFVLISSDKAVRPSSIMGATKRWAELIVDDCTQRALSAGSDAHFCAVRFGNVLGSNGSVVPLFKEQISAGGPVTLTDPAMTRYFMSVHEAAELIVQAGALSKGGDIFLLDMGEPVAIGDLAEEMVRLAGLTVRSPANPQGDIEIALIGARQGEKLREELFYNVAAAETTEQSKILRARRIGDQPVDVGAALTALRDAIAREDEAEVRRLLFSLPEMTETRQPAERHVFASLGV